MNAPKALSENKLIALLAAVQFVNVLDFMIVMPLGPDFAAALGIPTSQLGFIGGSYTGAAAVSGFAGSFFLDRFDRKKALVLAILGLVIGTVAGGFAVGFGSLLAARILAGAFGGPATSLSISILADVVPPERRGRAMGFVMGSFSLASIFGVPAGLEMARLYGWRFPFFAVAGLAFLVIIFASRILPSMKKHLENRKQASLLDSLKTLRKPEVTLAHLSIALVMFGSFLMIPNFSAYFQHNLGYPRASLGTLYFCGGLTALLAMLITGRLIDRFSSFSMGFIGTVFVIAAVYMGYYRFPPLLPAVGIFIAFMTSMTVRGISFSSLASRVPSMHERASFMSFQSAIQHAASACAAIASTYLLTESDTGMLIGMDRLALTCICLSLPVPFFMLFIEMRVRKAELQRRAIRTA